jgi:hypothetical protein
VRNIRGALEKLNSNAPAIHGACKTIIGKSLVPNCAAHSIRLTVAPDAKSYTLTIPATAHRRTFQTRGK